MAQREIIQGEDIPQHPQPFPTAVRLGNLLFSSAIGGKDLEAAEFPPDKDEQIRNAFKHVAAVMARAGGTPANIGKMTVYVADKADRKLINPHWIEMFPNEDDRPVRHTVQVDMPPGRYVQLEFIAVF